MPLPPHTTLLSPILPSLTLFSPPLPSPSLPSLPLPSPPDSDVLRASTTFVFQQILPHFLLLQDECLRECVEGSSNAAHGHDHSPLISLHMLISWNNSEKRDWINVLPWIQSHDMTTFQMRFHLVTYGKRGVERGVRVPTI